VSAGTTSPPTPRAFCSAKRRSGPGTRGDEQQGLDLLRLSVEALRGRYTASVETSAGGGIEVLLSSATPNDALKDARFLIDTDRNLLIGLSYHDLEGNLTRFEISGYGPLGEGAVFAPPAEIEWLEE
jgi:hypothetical protein